MYIDNLSAHIASKLTSYAKILMKDDFIKNIEKICSICIDCGGVLYICGNGGSMGDSLHFAAELTNRFRNNEEVPRSCKVLGSNICHTTATANDSDFEYIFSRELEGCGRNNDVLIVLSTSGKSNNIIKVIETAKRIGMKTIGLFGRDEVNLCDNNIYVNNINTDFIQEIHMIILHVIADSIMGAKK